MKTVITKCNTMYTYKHLNIPNYVEIKIVLAIVIIIIYCNTKTVKTDQQVEMGMLYIAKINKN